MQAKGADVSYDNLRYVGDAPVHDGVRELRIPDDQEHQYSGDIVKLATGELLLTVGGRCYVSSDDGRTFLRDAQRSCSSNMVVLRDGRLMRSQRAGWLIENGSCNVQKACPKCEEADANKCPPCGYRDYVQLSENGGRNWTARTYIQPNCQDRITMPNKLTLTSTGRVFFASGESGHAQEKEGSVHIYYSDDAGQTWTPSQTRHDMPTFGINLQEGKVVEVSGSRLKAYFRTDRGYLFESLSNDNGRTWSQPRATPFRATLTSFNIERDPTTGAHYMVWEYEDTDKHELPQYPRERVALAVSYDGTDTFQYVMNLDDWEGHPFRHMNHGLRVIDGHLWVHVPRREVVDPEKWELRLWQVDLSRIEPTYCFPGTH